MNNASVYWIIARLVVTVGLLMWAGLDLWLNPDVAEHPTAITIIGAVIGYWLSHAEQGVQNRLS